MSDTHSTDQLGDSCGVKDISDHPVRLALVEATLRTACDDAARILSAMLEKRETLADLMSSVDRRVVQKKAQNPAHCVPMLELRIHEYSDHALASKTRLEDVGLTSDREDQERAYSEVATSFQD